MSGWEPAWVPDGRGGFRRNNPNSNNPTSSGNNTNKPKTGGVAEEGEESGEMKDASSSLTPKLGGKNRKGSGQGGDDDEEEGEIANTPGGGGGGGSHNRNPISSSPGNLDNYRSPFRGGGGGGRGHHGGPINSRFGPSGGGGRGDHHRPRHQQRHSFTGATQQQRGFGPSSAGAGGPGHERSFSSGGGGGGGGSGGNIPSTASFGGGGGGVGGGPPSSRIVGESQQPPPKKPPSFRDRDLPKDSRSFSRDYGDSGSGGGPPPFGSGGGGRDFGSGIRKDGPSSHPDDPPKSSYHRSASSGGIDAPPSSRGGDFHHREHVPFRDRDYHRDRDHRGGGPSTGPMSLSDPKGRDYSRGGGDFGGGSNRGPSSSDAPNRDYRGGGGLDVKGPNRDFRDRNDSRDFGVRAAGGNPLSKRDGGGGGFGRDPYPKNTDPRGGVEGGGFKSGPSSSLHHRGDSASYGSSSREGSFRDGASFRDAHVHPSSSRGGGDSRDIPSKESLFQGVSRERDIPFGKRERDPPTFSSGGGSQYSRGGDSLIDRRPSFETKKEDHQHHKRDSSFGGAGMPSSSSDSNFGPKKRVDSRDRLVGPGSQRMNNPPFRGDGIVGGGGPSYVDKGGHSRAADPVLSSPSSFKSTPGPANPTLGIGLQSANPAVTTRPTDPRRPADPRRRPSKEPVVSAGPPVISSAQSQEGSGINRYPQPADASIIGASDDKLQETTKLKLPSPHPARRLGSYSSLADSGSISSSAGMPPPSPAQLDRPVTSGGGPRHGPGGYRASPLPPRRSSKDDFSPRNEQRGDYYGPPGGGTARLRSPANDRGRSLVTGSPSPNPNKIGIQNTSGPTSQQPPFAPTMTSGGGRPPQFRQNDPRIKLHERVKAEKEASYMSAPSSRGEKEIGLAKIQQGHGSSGDIVGVESPKKQSQTPQVDPFGRTRDWTDASKTASHHQETPGTTPASPTKKRQISTALASSQSRGQSHTSVGLGMDPGRSNVASSVSRPVEKVKAANSGSEVPPSKVEDLPPLRTSSLGDDTVVKRAESALKDLRVVISDPFPKTGNPDEAELPTKQQIMTAVTELEKMIKETQKSIEESSKEKLEVRNEEYAEFQKRKEESESLESERIVERDRKLSEHKEEEDGLKKIGLQKAIEDSKGLFLDAQKKLEEELDDQISQAKDDEKRRCYQDMESQMSTAASTFDKEIARAKRDVEKAKTAAQNLDSKVSTAEAQYRALIETKGDEMKNRGREDGISSSMVSVVSSISAENKRKAAEAQMLSLSMLCDDQEIRPESIEFSRETRDPLHGKSCEEWGILTKRVTGLSDALYSEPAESPYFQHNERIHGAIGPSVKEYIRDKQKRLLENWTELAEEYEVRKRLYEKQQKKLTKKARSGSVSVAGRKSILGNKDSDERHVFERVEGILESSSRPSNNPYRRARRGNEVRSEYEQDLIIAEIAAKEAMEKRIAHGSSKVPRQVCRLERELSASYVNTFTACKVDDPLQEAQVETITNVWSDMEKCIFFDRFLQFPKDFRRIASFLRNKSTKDCVAFYYDSKQSVPYKGALKEHMMRRKRRGDYQIWDASIQAAVSVGATVKAGPSSEKPVTFSLPPTDRSFNTRLLHPLTRDVLDSIPMDESLARMAEEDVPEETKPRSRKRSRDPLFSLEKEQTKYLCKASQESLSGAHPIKLTVSASKQKPLDETSKPVESESAVQTPGRRAPQKWTAAEKKIFEDTVGEHGRDWAMLAKAVGTKSISQIKNYYYDFKKQKGRHKSSTDKKNTSSAARKAAASSKSDPSKTNDITTEAKARKKENRVGRVDDEVEVVAVTPPPQRREKKKEKRKMIVDTGTSQIPSEEVASQQRPSFQAESARETTSHVGFSTGLMRATSQFPEVTSSAPLPSAQHDAGEYGDTATSRELLLQQLLRQQLQEQQHHHHQQHQQQQQQQHQQHQQQDIPHHRQEMSHHRQVISQHRQQELSQHRQQELSRHRQALQHQQLHLGQQPQSAIQQALSQHHQRDSQHLDVPQHIDDLHRLIQQQQQHQQQSQSHHQQQQAFSNLLPYFTASQLLQHNQPRLQHHQQDGTQLSEMNDVANIQRLLQIQQNQAPAPYGVSSLLAGGGRQSASNSGISSSLRSQLDQLHTAGAPGGSSEAGASSISAALSGGQGLENLSGLAGAQGLLGFGGSNHLSGSNPNSSLGGLAGTSGLYRQGGNGGQGIDPSGVPDTLSLLTSAMSRRDGPGHGFGGVQDRNEGGGGRY